MTSRLGTHRTYVLTGTDFKRSDPHLRLMAQPGRWGTAGIDRVALDDETFDCLSKQKTVSYEIAGPAATVRGTWEMTIRWMQKPQKAPRAVHLNETHEARRRFRGLSRAIASDTNS
jgi:hypothetical protein